MVLKTNI